MKWINFKDELPKPNEHILVRIRKNVYVTRIWHYNFAKCDIRKKSLKWMSYANYCKMLESI